MLIKNLILVLTLMLSSNLSSAEITAAEKAATMAALEALKRAIEEPHAAANIKKIIDECPRPILLLSFFKGADRIVPDQENCDALNTAFRAYTTELIKLKQTYPLHPLYNSSILECRFPGDLYVVLPALQPDPKSISEYYHDPKIWPPLSE